MYRFQQYSVLLQYRELLAYTFMFFKVRTVRYPDVYSYPLGDDSIGTFTCAACTNYRIVFSEFWEFSVKMFLLKKKL